MLKTLSLTLPVLFPSWRFFKSIEPSPRVQWALVSDSEPKEANWQEFRPRPLTISLFQILGRLFWNPGWNDTLFVVSCAERIQECPTPHSIDEIRRRIVSDVRASTLDTTDKLLQFRLIFVHHDGQDLVQEVVFLSDTSPTTDPGTW